MLRHQSYRGICTMYSLLSFHRFWSGAVLLFISLLYTSFFGFNSIVDAAQTAPYKVNFQGRLTDINGNVMPNGLYNIKFRLMSASSGGTNLWQADRVYTGSGTGDHRVQVTNGLFSVQLGDTATGVGDPALSPSIFNTQTNATIYVEIELPTPATATCATVSCASFTEGAMTPRQLMAAAPYAMNADTIDGIDGASLAQLSANNTFSGNNTFTGTFTYQPASDSTTAFQIKNNSGAALLVADTTNLALKVGGGDVSPSGSPALLVLDYKNTSSDPTGVDGAMYYNSTTGKFRCQEGGAWGDCIPAERARYEYHHDLTIASVTVANGTPLDGVLMAGAINSGAFTRLSGELNRPGILRLTTSTSSNASAAIANNYDPSNVAGSVLFGAGSWVFTTAARVGTLSTSSQRFTSYNGFTDNQSNFGNAPTGPHNGCYIRYVDNQNSGKWQGVCRNADNETGSTCDTGVTVATSTWYVLKVAVNPAATQATFVVNDTNSCSVTTNIPTTNAVPFAINLLKSIGTTASTVDYDYIEVIGQGLVRN